MVGIVWGRLRCRGQQLLPPSKPEPTLYLLRFQRPLCYCARLRLCHFLKLVTKMRVQHNHLLQRLPQVAMMLGDKAICGIFQYGFPLSVQSNDLVHHGLRISLAIAVNKIGTKLSRGH